MREFQADGRTINAYLAEPELGSGPRVLVLHAWWGLTDVFKQVCDRFAEAGFVALALDLYHCRTTASVEEAQTLASALDRDVERGRARGRAHRALRVRRDHVRTCGTRAQWRRRGDRSLVVLVDGRVAGQRRPKRARHRPRIAAIRQRASVDRAVSGLSRERPRVRDRRGNRPALSAVVHGRVRPA